MNPELPKPVRNALASQPAGESHPSADLLSAFAEHTLTTGETHHIADHLATCAECRDVVFLASADEAAAPEQAAIPVGRPRSAWMPRMAWIMSGAAVFAIAGGILIQQWRQRDNSSREVAQVAPIASPQAPSVAEPEVAERAAPAASAKEPATEAPSKALKVVSPPQRHEEAVRASKAAPPPAMEAPPMTSSPLAAGAVSSPGNVIGEASNSLRLPSPTQNSFAERQDQTVQFAPPGQASAASNHALLRMSGKTWRVTSEGQLEHLLPSGWTGVLTDRATKFQVVSEAPNGIWAGGTQGELFHSEDGGQHWTAVALPIPSNSTGALIISIHFADLHRGTILTPGAIYTTSDGGKNWTKQ